MGIEINKRYRSPQRKERLVTPTLSEALVITAIIKDLPPISSSSASLSTISLNLTPTACRLISRFVRFDISLGNNIICSFIFFLIRASFLCILLDILSLSRLCGRLSPFLRNLRTNRKRTYYIQHPTKCLHYQNSLDRGAATWHKRTRGEVRIDYDGF